MKREKKSTVKSVQPQSFESDTERTLSVFSNDNLHSLNGEKNMSKKFDFTSLVAAEKQQSVDDHAEYQIVLREIASDKCDRPQAEILRLLERCERETSDLKADVEWRVKRDEQIAEIKKAKEYRTKNSELLAKLQSLREEFEKAEAEYDATRYPIIYESDTLEDKLKNIERYRADLFRTCRDANMKIELQVLENSFDPRVEAGLYARQNAIRCEIQQLEHERDNLPITPDRSERKRVLKQEIKRLQEEWEQVEVKKGEIAQKKTEHQWAVAELREKMIYS